MKLYCLTYAGGNASFYDRLERFVSADITLVKLEYSGHGLRHKEPFYADFDELAQDMYEYIKRDFIPERDQAYALMGYSMGSISAVEVLRLIKNRGEIINPVQVFLAAHEPNTKANIIGCTEEELDEIVKKRTIGFGEIPEQLVHNKSFWRMYLPIYRADYGIIAKYDFDNLNFKSAIPATVFYSETDTSLNEMRKWNNIFVGVCEFIEYEGTHFFIQEHYKEIAGVISSKLVFT